MRFVLLAIASLRRVPRYDSDPAYKYGAPASQQ